MAQRRMFAKTVIDSDEFLEMPLSAQALYFHLSMRADDDGFLNNARKIRKIIGASEDDLKILIMKKFVIFFEGGIIVIRHWRLNNYLRKDRYTPTLYRNEKSMLEVEENGTYSLVHTSGIPDGNQMETQVSIGKDSIGYISTTSEEKKKQIILPVSDGSSYVVYEKQIREWEQAFPKLDVSQEILRARAWLISNSDKQKERKEIPRFLNGWLNHALERQEKPGQEKSFAGQEKPLERKTRFSNFQEREYDMSDMERRLLEAGQ